MTFVPPPPPAKKSNTKRILIIVAIVLVLCCGGGITGAVLLFRGVQEATGPARDVAVAYVEDIMAGDYHGAYGRLCDRVQASTSEADYTRVQTAQLKISKYEVTGTSIKQMNSTTTAVITMRLTQAETGAVMTQGFPLLKEDGEWRVCG
ncbi:DUF4878 domain-containing protein [Catellatospora bangladeshensis]|uniref:DUF4878 domain-containing protein n=1 Tax=Catellatospora bangladeshensis TaxID=310355 RepID=A0A8J3JNE5_9ACTN|nr:DUF4878 domain-containing protein [Catellatospora bangladeshensis]GIF81064.1 hypothetical protein Cba03nite_24130 [Catellatospora bangladeshensis]